MSAIGNDSDGQRKTEMHPPSPHSGTPLNKRVHAPKPKR